MSLCPFTPKPSCNGVSFFFNFVPGNPIEFFAGDFGDFRLNWERHTELVLLPDTVGTGGDSHTRFPMGISFPAGSGLVAFAAAIGVMPLDMPESVLVRFSGEMQPGITLRDLVNAIPYAAIQRGLLTVAKEGKKNIFSGRIRIGKGTSSRRRWRGRLTGWSICPSFSMLWR